MELWHTDSKVLTRSRICKEILKNYSKGWAWPLLKHSKKKYLKRGAVSMQIAGAIREENRECRQKCCGCGNVIRGRRGMSNRHSSVVLGRLRRPGGSGIRTTFPMQKLIPDDIKDLNFKNN